ncbi:hypothetical protein LTR62_001299 [Meristemomyces frigidus]|uniref:DUF7137 domain-containing protein n=1 Tax=Meristemomyces frigidus TaxID=1508187 RepID=A0AAN7TJU9_9PEZI|nr:hypothetical protein LTR62_001299 [Meristemomyces frigidus]
MRSTRILAPIYILVAASSAWRPLEMVRREMAQLLPRQGGSQSTTYNLSFSASSASPTSSANTDASSATPTDSNTSGGSSTGTNQGSQTGSQTNSQGSQITGSPTRASGTGTNTSKKGSVTQFDPRLPPGGIQMITPAAIAPVSYYKIADWVTFAWNYTSLSITPSAVDILATCTLNNAMYTIAMNQTITGPTQEVLWDTNGYQATAATTLLTGTYTLIIHDAAKDVSATPSAGYLAAYNQFTFGMYVPQAYTPIADYVCATCNAGVSSMERQTVGFLVAMVGVTVVSFGWFAGVAGVW